METTVCGQARGCSVSRIAAGIAIMSPNANVTPSIRMSNADPKPSCPSVSSSDDRMGAHTTSSASTAPQLPTAAAMRPRFTPAKPRIAITAAVMRGRTTGTRTAADGMPRLS